MNKNDIVVIYGDNCFESTLKLLKFIKIEQLIPSKTSKIALKPNLVIADTPERGATTHPQIVIAIIEYLKEKGFENISIIESAWIGDSTKKGFMINGYEKISKKYNVPLIDVKDDEYQTFNTNGIKMEISKEIMNTDFLISLPVLKGHCQTLMTCALKNMKGCLSDKSKRLFHNLGLMKPIATLNKNKCANLVIVDSINGDLDFEEGGNPVKTDRMFACMDSVLCDTFAASLLGYSTKEIEYIELASDMNVGNKNLNDANIININKPMESSNFKPKGEVAQLAKYTKADKACSACYGNLIHSIKRLTETGYLNDNKKICIGQGYRNVENPSLIGVGTCTNKLGKSLKGCPPSANEMIEFLKNL